MNLNRVITGAQAEGAGRAFEGDLGRAHEAYQSLGLATVHQLPVPTVPIRGKLNSYIAKSFREYLGRLRTLSTRQGYDFYGTFGPNAGPEYDPCRWHGLAIAMESKSSTSQTTRLPIVEKSKKGHSGFGLKVHQLNALVDAYRNFGAVSVVVWRNGDERLVLMPDAMLRAHECYHSGGRRSVPFSEFQQYDVFSYPNHAQIDDWLYPVRCWLEHHGRPSPALSKLKAYDMVTFSIDSAKRTVTIGQGESANTIPLPLAADQAILNRLARESADESDLVRRIQQLGSADE